MPYLSIVKTTLTWVGIALGLLSAYFWYKASVAKITQQRGGIYPAEDILIEDPQRSGQQIYVFATAVEQSRVNKIAALLTAASVACQAVSSALPGTCDG